MGSREGAFPKSTTETAQPWQAGRPRPLKARSSALESCKQMGQETRRRKCRGGSVWYSLQLQTPLPSTSDSLPIFPFWRQFPLKKEQKTCAHHLQLKDWYQLPVLFNVGPAYFSLCSFCYSLVSVWVPGSPLRDPVLQNLRARKICCESLSEKRCSRFSLVIYMWAIKKQDCVKWFNLPFFPCVIPT